MTVKFKAVSVNKAGVAGERAGYQARITDREKIGLKGVAEYLSRESTISRADISAVLAGLTDLLPELLKDNKAIELGDLGIFTLHAGSNTESTLEEVDRHSINELRISFRPAPALKKAVQDAKLLKVK